MKTVLLSKTLLVRPKLMRFVFSALLVSSLGACDGLEDFKYLTDIQKIDGQSKTAMEANAGKDGSAKSHDPLTVSDDIWVGNQAVRMRKGQPLATALENDKGFTLVAGTPLTINEIAAQVATTTGIPVRVGDMTLSQNAVALARPAAGTAGGPQPMLISYEGPLSAFLDQVAGHFDVSWRYDGQTIHMFKYETRTFVMEALPGTQAVSDGFDGGSDSGGGSSGGSSGGSGGSSSSSNELKQSNTNTASLDYWKELDAAVKSVLAGDGTSIISPTAGTVTVTATPQLMQRVAQFVDSENMRLGKQIAIDVAVYSVNIDDTNDYGLDLNGAFTSGDATGGLVGPSIGNVSDNLSKSSLAAGTLTFSIVGKDFSLDNTVIKALSRFGNVATITRSPIITLNNRAASRKIAVDEAYLASTSTTQTANVGSTTSLTPGTVSTGITLQVLPRMLDDGRILLQYSIKLSDLLNLTTFTTADNSSSIQLPQVQNRTFIQQAVLQSGSTLILSGFEQDKKVATSAGIGNAMLWFLGGGKSNTHANQRLVVTLTPQEVTPARGTTYN